MRIIKHSTPPNGKLYIHTCRTCSTEFEFRQDEARAFNDRDGNALVIRCPVCNRECWVAADKTTPDTPSYITDRSGTRQRTREGVFIKGNHFTLVTGDTLSPGDWVIIDKATGKLRRATPEEPNEAPYRKFRLPLDARFRDGIVEWDA